MILECNINYFEEHGKSLILVKKLGDYMYIENEKEMKAWAIEFASKIEIPSVISLEGDLGAGKTRLVQWIGEALGSKNIINSPTFDLIHRYDSNIGPIRHLDLYRLEDPEEVEELDYEEAFYPEDGLTFIEWAEKVKPYLPDGMIRVRIDKGIGEERKVEIL